MSSFILIGGPPRTGKTTLAQKIAKAKGISWISTDALDDIAKEYVPEGDRNILFPKTALRVKSGGGNDEMYAAFTTEEITDAYLTQAKTVHAAIESFIRCADVEGWNYIIEGYHITPSLVTKLQSEFENLSAVILISSAPEEVVERSMQSGTKQDWLRDKTNREETFGKVADMIRLFSEKVRQEAEGTGVTVLDTSTQFEERIAEAEKYLMQ